MENKELNLCEILKDCPTGTKFWSPVWGDVTFVQINDVGVFPIVLSAKSFSNSNISLRSNGKMYDIKEAECLLYPSKYQRDWSKFVRFWDKKSVDKPVTEKFDPKTLHEWDKILVRKVHSPFNISPWSCEYFSYINPNTPHLVNGIASRYEICIPYNDETKHLRGTTDDCPEYYKWWKLEKGFWWEE